jgi:hypothetical protein
MARKPRSKRDSLRDRIGLNFIRPDVGRPGNHDFLNSGVWLVSQFKDMGVKWNRLAFSWVLIEPQQGSFNWEPYDRIVEACDREGIQILATLGGHFDRPPVPAWAGESLADVVRTNPAHLERFVEAWVQRYRGSIRYWEILNEPGSFHKDLTVAEYVERILKPSYTTVKSVQPDALVLPCSFGHLPVLGEKTEFWDAARGYYDIHNLHIYVDWGIFRTRPSAEPEETSVRDFRALIERQGEADKPLWITEIGWWGTGNITSHTYDIYKRDPRKPSLEFLPSYRGREILEHPVVLREDALRAEWLKDMYPRLLSVPGCEKAFLWVSLDEFEGGYDPERVYGKSAPDESVSQLDLWGIIAGDKTWRKSAHALQQLIRSSD